jgi:hypothetical protein
MPRQSANACVLRRFRAAVPGGRGCTVKSTGTVSLFYFPPYVSKNFEKLVRPTVAIRADQDANVIRPDGDSSPNSQMGYKYKARAIWHLGRLGFQVRNSKKH